MYLLHALQGLEEDTPELVTAVLAIGDCAEAALQLQANNVSDGSLLDRNQRLCGLAIVSYSVAMLDEVIRS